MSPDPFAEHRWPIRVYYEDTDLAGVVYYANYLKFIERARTEWVRSLGVSQAALKAETGLVFVVSRCEIDFRRPARMDDGLMVATRLLEARRASLKVAQSVDLAERADDPAASGDLTLAAAKVTIACVDAAGKPARLPPPLAARAASG